MKHRYIFNSSAIAAFGLEIVVCLVAFLGAAEARAESMSVVAIGADNVYGKGRGGRNPGGVSPNEAFPAQLEQLLRARGIDAHVTNAGVPGDTSEGMLGRLDSSVPDGTQLVVLDRANGNDKKTDRYADQASYINDIRSRLSARGIALIILPAWESIPGAIANRDPDGHHFTAQGHASIARYLLPKVVALLGRPSPNRRN
jgi:acyl-CoA thioesterase-1